MVRVVGRLAQVVFSPGLHHATDWRGHVDEQPGPAKLLTATATVGLLCVVLLSACPSLAQVYRWDNGNKISDTTPEPYANFSNQNLDYADLVGSWMPHARFYETDLTMAILVGANLSGANLTGAKLDGAVLTNTNLSGAVVVSASFDSATSNGFTAAQLYSTASYQEGNLYGICLMDNDLSGWNFASKDLSKAKFGRADLSSANLSGANLTKASFMGATCKDTDLSDAGVAGVSFGSTTDSGFIAGQLYSSKS